MSGTETPQCPKCLAHDIDLAQRMQAIHDTVGLLSIAGVIMQAIQASNIARTKTSNQKFQFMHQRNIDYMSTLLAPYLIALPDKDFELLKKAWHAQYGIDLKIQHVECPHKEQGKTGDGVPRLVHTQA